MSLNDLHSKIVAAKNFLNSEMVRLRTNNDTVSAMGYRELELFDPAGLEKADSGDEPGAEQADEETEGPVGK